MKITKRAVDGLKADGTDRILFDEELKGFGVRIKPSGVKTYLVQYRNPEGRTRRLSLGKHGPLTPDTARSLAKQRLGEVEAGEDPSAERKQARDVLSLHELADRYMEEHAREKKKPRSAREDERLIRRYILPKLGHRSVPGLSARDVGRLHHSLKATPYQANRVLAVLSKMMELATRWGFRPDGSNPCVGVERFRERKRERFLSAEEVTRLGEALRATEEEGHEMPSAILAIRLLLLTGARKTEILRLRWDEVDFERRCLRLSDSKTGEKTIPLNAPALELLSEAPSHEGNPYVCPGVLPGAALVGLPKIWYRIRERAGLEEVRLHDLRHSFAAVGAGAGFGLPIIGALLGHTEPQTTARYAHVATDPRQEATERIGGEIAALLNAGTGGEVIPIRSRRS